MAEPIENAGTQKRFGLSPIVVLTAALTALTTMLLLIKTVPIGLMYWDLNIYFAIRALAIAAIIPIVMIVADKIVRGWAGNKSNSGN